MISKSYLDKSFTVEDRDARLRTTENLLKFVTFQAGETLPAGKSVGDPKTIPQRTVVGVIDTRVENKTGFVLTRSAGDASVVFGWTSSRNLAGKFANETLGEVLPVGSNKTGPNAAWEGGAFLRQVVLVDIVDGTGEVERITIDSLPAFQSLVAASEKDGIGVLLRDGFRTFADQEFLFKGFQQHKPGFNKAARPGSSNHQSGRAFDLIVGGFDGDPIYDWLKTHAPGFGFIRTVNKEPWHWELRPGEAAKLAAKGLHKLPGVKL